MANNKSTYAVEVKIKNIKQISTFKKELKSLRAEMRATEKKTADGAKLGKREAKRYSVTAKAVKQKSKALRDLNKDISQNTGKVAKATKANNGMAKQFIKGAAAIGILVTAFRTVNRAVSSIISTFSEFEFVMAKLMQFQVQQKQSF